MDHHASLGPAVPEGTHPTAPSAPVRVEPPPNQLGHYRLHERVGVGGQAAVYRARRLDDPDGRDVALKRLHPHLIDDPGSVQGFSREARIAYLLDHPVIRRVLALHRQPAELFMVMEYVDGLSVTDLLRRAAASERCLPLAGVLTVLDRVCDALAYAHELVDERGASAGLVHRDVSPSNVLVTSAGRVKLIDLGVARSESAEHATSSGLIKGKYGYMAPEVMQGAPFDRRADVFSVGVLAWELVTIRKLFPVNQHAFDLDRVRARPIAPPSQLNPACPAALDAVILRALATAPAERWPSCAAMAAALRDVARRLGEPLHDHTVAHMVNVREGLPTHPTPRDRPRLARGTPAVVATDEAAARAPAPAPVAITASPPPPPRSCRRLVLIGGAIGAAATAIAAVVMIARAPDPALTPPDATVARAAAPPALPDATVVAIAVAAPPPDAAPPLERAPVDAGSPDAAPLDAGPLDAGPLDAGPADAASPSPPSLPTVDRVDAAVLTRLRGRPPRSRSSTSPYVATVCIDATGAVTAVDVQAAPERLKPRIAHALGRWRYQPYRDGAGARPVCFDVVDRLHRATP